MSRRDLIDVFVDGVPYSQNKVRGDKEAALTWTEAVKQQTCNLPKIRGRCYTDVRFFLPANKYPKDHPNGPDLDNLLKRLFDALNDTVFSEAGGKDGCIVRLAASKMRVTEGKPTGARVRITELD